MWFLTFQCAFIKLDKIKGSVLENSGEIPFVTLRIPMVPYTQTDLFSSLAIFRCF